MIGLGGSSGPPGKFVPIGPWYSSGRGSRAPVLAVIAVGRSGTANPLGGVSPTPSPKGVCMKPATLIAALLFALVAVAHLVRLIFQIEVLVGSATIPMWVSVVGIIVPGALAVALWREAQASGSTLPNNQP